MVAMVRSLSLNPPPVGRLPVHFLWVSETPTGYSQECGASVMEIDFQVYIHICWFCIMR